MDQQKVGAFIADRRRIRGLTQRDLADRLNVTDKAVSKWERGLSYPDITMITPLSEALGVTERELLMGERLEGEEDAPPPDVSWETVSLSYLGAQDRQRRQSALRIVMAAFTAVTGLGAFICLICDLAISKRFTWSLIVLASCALAWAVLLPLCRAPGRKIFWSSVCLTLLIVPFLAVVEAAAPVRGWLLSPALPLAALCLGWLWVLVLLHTFTRISKWYVLAVGVVLSAPLSYLINRTVDAGQEPWEIMLNSLCTLVGAAAIVSVGYFLRRRGMIRNSTPVETR